MTWLGDAGAAFFEALDDFRIGVALGSVAALALLMAAGRRSRTPTRRRA